jgi:uncharacterized protein YecT (DUF1311 family)
MLKFALVGLVLVAVPLQTRGARAEDVTVTVRYSQTYERCIDNPNAGTADMVGCMNAEFQRWDRRLNAAYAALMKSDDHAASVKDLLREAQRAWMTYRDKACTADGELTAAGGTLETVSRSQCVLQMTAQRAVELESYSKSGG